MIVCVVWTRLFWFKYSHRWTFIAAELNARTHRQIAHMHTLLNSHSEICVYEIVCESARNSKCKRAATHKRTSTVYCYSFAIVMYEAKKSSAHSYPYTHTLIHSYIRLCMPVYKYKYWNQASTTAVRWCFGPFVPLRFFRRLCVCMMYVCAAANTLPFEFLP